MASVRGLKKDIDYLVEELLADCYLTMYFNQCGQEKSDKVVNVMRQAVDLRNDLFQRANNPVEKNNRSLVKKHYAQVRRDMFTGIDKLFLELSGLNKK